jgi:DNA-binding HxlR family transcriptional regulator
MRVSQQVSGLARHSPEARPETSCPERVLLDHVTSRWGVLVLVALREGRARWSELRRAVSGVSEKMLAQTLQTLERDGLVVRTAHAVVPRTSTTTSRRSGRIWWTG